MSRRTRTGLLIAIASLAIAACWLPIRMRFPFDDTYITFRYAANLAHGFGIVWNPGGPTTEGYTNFLLVLLLAPFSALGWNLVAVSQAIGVIAVTISAIAIYGIVGSACGRPPGGHSVTPENGRLRAAPTVATALFLLDPFTWMNAYSGLETSLFTMWLVLAVWAFASEKMELSFAFATFATLTRPEGGLMGMILLAVGWLHSRKRSEAEESPSVLAYWVAAFAIPLAIYAGWKLWYFGNLLPNSFYVKVSQAHASSLVSLFPGRGAMRIFYGGVWYLLPFAAIAVWKLRKGKMVRAVALWCLLLTIFYFFSQLIQNDYQRFSYPIEVFLILLTAMGIITACPKSRLWPLVSMIVVLATQTYWTLEPRGGIGYIERTSEAESTYPHLAAVFRSIPNYQAITLAWGDAGRLPYYSGLYSIDPVGLNTNEIAHARTAAEVVHYVIHAKPDLIVIPLVYRRDETPGWNDSCRMILPHGQGLIGSAYPALARAALAATYKPLFMSPQPVYDIEFLVDTTSPQYLDIVNTIVPLIGHDSDFEAPAMRIQ